MRRLLKIVLFAGLAYLGFWALTWWAAPHAIRRELMREATKTWEASRARGLASAREFHAKWPKEFPAEMVDRIAEGAAFESGPSVDVRLISCPFPFWVRAECGRRIGGLNGYGSYDEYIVVGWRAFAVSSYQTWVS